jgi:hypothetical protein
MIKRLVRLLLLTLVLPLSACAEPTLREGLWELSFQDVKWRDKQNPARDGMDFPQPRRLAEVLLETSPDGAEMAQINFVEEVQAAPEEGAASDERPEAPGNPPQPAVRPMFADIRRAVETNPPTIHIEDRDATYIWRMWGVIVAPEEIRGTHFSALLGKTGGGLEGRWHMRWLGGK